MSRRRQLAAAVRALMCAAQGALLVSACGVVDGACWQVLVTNDEICAKLVRLDEKARGCPGPESLPALAPERSAEICDKLSDCLHYRSDCADEWTDLLECLDADQDCAKIVDGRGISGFCVGRVEAYLQCKDKDENSGNQDLVRGCWSSGCNDDGVCDLATGELPDNCGKDCGSGCNNNGLCELSNSEYPQNCSSDCPTGCTDNGVCSSAEGPWCSDCGCDLDLQCEPATENSASCPACQCNGDSDCDPGESRWTCPEQCP